jgi:hypothetical protein
MKAIARSNDDLRLSFDAAFIGRSLAVGATLFVLLLTIKGLSPERRPARASRM